MLSEQLLHSLPVSTAYTVAGLSASSPAIDELAFAGLCLQVVAYLLEDAKHLLFPDGGSQYADGVFTKAMKVASAGGMVDTLRLLTTKQGDWIDWKCWRLSVEAAHSAGQKEALELLHLATVDLCQGGMGQTGPSGTPEADACEQELSDKPVAKVLSLDDALISAAEHDCMQAVPVLVAQGADVHAGWGAALRAASIRGNTEMVRLLLSCGAGQRQDEMCAALQKAIDTRHFEVVAVLAEHGAQVGVRQKRELMRLGYDTSNLSRGPLGRVQSLMLRLYAAFFKRKCM
jgi:hypothetical protein